MRRLHPRMRAPSPHPNSGLPEFGTIEWSKSDKSDFDWGEGWDEGVAVIQLKLSNPLTPALSPPGRGSSAERVARVVSHRGCLSTLAALCTLLAFTSAYAQDAPAGNVDNGKAVYLKVGCFTCHGRVGQGGGYNTPVPALAKTEMPFEGFKFQLRNPSRDMPAYADMVMTDQEIADVYAFVRSLPGKRDPKEIPLLAD
jgi:mono/diheme cytochrome c family protein